MKKVFYVITVLLALTACKTTKTEYSPNLTEKARVVDLIYTPAVHGSGVGPTVSTNGSFGLAFVDVDTIQKYAVVFECPHGKFIVENNQRKTKELWQKLKKDQEVTVTYREIYRATYEDDSLLERRLKKYDFIDAD
ncbi:MAG: hypothetical protein Q7S11_04305 [bacterium]|nr:hypothetical protein [bacterium]